ncbi:MAG TPA: hypothetical protein VFF81_00960 [Noviherbaspirillum sp.]|nr:hypothetical protein [Noviherbaspirillum sp.]
MTKLIFRHTVSAVKMAVAMMPLAGCDTGIERWSARLGGQLDSAFSSGHESVRDLTQAEKPISIEHRHYDIYTRYRAAFEESTERFDVDQVDGEGGVQMTGSARDGGYSSALLSCSVRMLMALD